MATAASAIEHRPSEDCRCGDEQAEGGAGAIGRLEVGRRRLTLRDVRGDAPAVLRGDDVHHDPRRRCVIRHGDGERCALTMIIIMMKTLRATLILATGPDRQERANVTNGTMSWPSAA